MVGVNCPVLLLVPPLPLNECTDPNLDIPCAHIAANDPLDVDDDFEGGMSSSSSSSS